MKALDEIVLRSLDFDKRRPTVILVEDFENFRSLRDGRPQSALAEMMRDLAYQPVAQCLFSTLYVAEDWPILFERSAAYSRDAVQLSVLPGYTGAA